MINYIAICMAVLNELAVVISASKRNSFLGWCSEVGSKV